MVSVLGKFLLTLVWTSMKVPVLVSSFNSCFSFLFLLILVNMD